MTGIPFLAWCYLRRHPGRSLTVLGALGLLIALPLGLALLVDAGARSLRSRAATTPLVVGAPGSPLELTLAGCYFRRGIATALPAAAVAEARSRTAGAVVPLHVAHHCQEHSIVGSDPDYHRQRDLRLDRGRPVALVGECVLGAAAARSLDLDLGDRVVPTPSEGLGLGVSYPVGLRVVGVLTTTGDPDDGAIFTDLKTCWMLDGLGHGHDEPSGGTVLERDASGTIASAAVHEDQDFFPGGLTRFHLHGDPADFPVHVALVFPREARDAALLQVAYQTDPTAQVVVPSSVVDELLQTVAAIRHLVLAALLLATLAAIALLGLVLALAIRLRGPELRAYVRLGAARGNIATLLATEILLLGLGALALAALAVMLATWLGPDLVTRFLL